MRVPLLDLTRDDPETTADLRAAFERVLLSGQFVLGPDVELMERECADYLGAGHAIGVSSGTDALIVALMALGIGPGDEVICPTYTFFATAGAIWRMGARPVFVDSDERTLQIDPERVAAAVGPRTRAIIPVHLFGACADLDPILAVAVPARVPVVEDAAQAVGSRYRERAAGTIGAIGCFSFFPTKNLGCLGDGGLVTSQDADLADRIRVLRVHGMRPKYYHETVGANFRIDTLQAAFVRVRLTRLDAAAEARRRNAVAYRHALTAAEVVGELDEDRGPGASERRHIVLPAGGDDVGHTYNQFVIRVRGPVGSRDGLRAHLAAAGVGSEVYYPVPLHLQRCFASLGHAAGDFPIAERAAAETLALPIFPGLRGDELACVVTAIVDWCRQS